MLVEYGNHRLKDHTIQKKTKYSSAVEDRRGHFSPFGEALFRSSRLGT